jgi:hypothetical protein
LGVQFLAYVVRRSESATEHPTSIVLGDFADDGQLELLVTKRLIQSTAILFLATLSLFATSAHAGESYFYQGTRALETSFFLIGGQHTLYVYASVRS